MQKNKKEYQFIEYLGEKNIITLLIKAGDGSKFDFINENKYLNIKYDGLNNYDEFLDEEIKERLIPGTYHSIKFNLNQAIDADYLEEELSKIIDKETKNKRNKYENILKKIIEYFDTVTSEKNTEKLRGDLGEALFVLKCLQLGLIDNIQGALQKREDEDNLDFYFKNNQTVEIKTTTKLKSEINLKLKQAKIENDNCHIVIVKIDNYEKTKIDENYYNIIDIYNEIEKYTVLNNELNNKKNRYKNNIEIVKNNYININEYEMGFVNKKFIPVLDWNKIKNDEALNDIIFVLNAGKLIENVKEFEKKLKAIVNIKI